MPSSRLAVGATLVGQRHGAATLVDDEVAPPAVSSISERFASRWWRHALGRGMIRLTVREGAGFRAPVAPQMISGVRA